MDMTVSKEYVSNYTRKLYKFLQNGHYIQFSKRKSYRGWITTNTFPTHLIIDHTDKLLPTLIHESLHYFYPDKSEEWVLAMETKIMNKLTERQVKNIIRKLAQNI